MCIPTRKDVRTDALLLNDMDIGNHLLTNGNGVYHEDFFTSINDIRDLGRRPLSRRILTSILLDTWIHNHKERRYTCTRSGISKSFLARIVLFLILIAAFVIVHGDIMKDATKEAKHEISGSRVRLKGGF